MSNPHFPEPVLFFIGVLYRKDLVDLKSLDDALSETFQTNKKRFSLTLENAGLASYYEKEMGPKEQLERLWVCQDSLESRENLLSLKERANHMEKEVLKEKELSGRLINLDPGYIALEQVMLATNKPYSHRAYLGKGIYTDLVYQYQNKQWLPLPWTYPDYQDLEVKSFFDQQREHLLKKMRKA